MKEAGQVLRNEKVKTNDEFLVKKKQLSAFKYDGFWICMDTIRDKQVIEEILRKKSI